MRFPLLIFCLLLLTSVFGQQKPLCAEYETDFAFYDNIRFLPAKLTEYHPETDSFTAVYEEKNIVVVKEMTVFKQTDLPADLRSNFKKKWALLYVPYRVENRDTNLLLLAQPLKKQ